MTFFFDVCQLMWKGNIANKIVDCISFSSIRWGTWFPHPLVFLAPKPRDQLLFFKLLSPSFYTLNDTNCWTKHVGPKIHQQWTTVYYVTEHHHKQINTSKDHKTKHKEISGLLFKQKQKSNKNKKAQTKQNKKPNKEKPKKGRSGGIVS